MILNRVLDENQLSLQPTSTLPHLTSNQSSTANGRHRALSALTAGHRPLRRAARPLIILIYLRRANEGWQTRWERKVWGSSLTSPVITHSPLLSPLQTLLSNWTGHGQLWHMPEQRMHYLQVSGHYSSKTPWSKCGPFFLLEVGKGGGDARLMWMLLMSTQGRVTFTHHTLSESMHLCPTLLLSPHTALFTASCLAGVAWARHRDKRPHGWKEKEGCGGAHNCGVSESRAAERWN